MPLVKALRTPTELDAVTRALSDAWFLKFRQPILPDVLALLLALSDLETATWKSCWHWNLGNIIIAPAYLATTIFSFFTLEGDEGEGSGSDADEHHYKAYDDLASGAFGLIDQLTRTVRQQWWDGLLTGNPVEFCRALKGLNGGPEYFEAGLDRYTKGFISRWNRYSPPGSAPHIDQLDKPAQAKQPLSKSLPVLSMSSGGLAVVLCQVLLNTQGYGLQVDGEFGPKTQEAVERLQGSIGWWASGIVNADAWSMLLTASENRALRAEDMAGLLAQASEAIQSCRRLV